MKTTTHRGIVVALRATFTVASIGLATAVSAQTPGPSNAAASVKTFAAGLLNPRGLKFGPDGNLYVAEGGSGGTHSTAGQCTQVVPPVGPYTGSDTGGRISRIDAQGNRTTVTDTLPSSQTQPIPSRLISGVADVAFVDGTLYALLAGAGCSHGASMPNGVVRVNSNGTWSLIANLSAYQQANPTKVIEPDDFEPDGTWYGMVAVRGALYAVEPNHGEMVKITPDGKITRVIDISARLGHEVPTAIAYHGVFYVGNLGRFDPDDVDQQKIVQITPSGELRVVATGLSKVLGVAFDGRGRLYALEMSKGDAGPVPFTGRLVRVTRNGDLKVLVDGLFFPTGMTFGPDGALYVSNAGFGPPVGEILRIEVPDAD